MYPLDYTDRIEHAVLLYPTDWNDLYELFTYPKAYLENAFHSFIGAIPPTWRVSSQVSFNIEPLPQTMESVVMVNEALSPHGIGTLGYDDVFGVDDGKKNVSGPASTAQIQKNLRKITGKDTPFIIIQFAVNSGAVHVSYVPPALDDPKGSGSKPQVWFDKTPKPFTLSHGSEMPEGNKLILSRTHFDLESQNLTKEQINSLRARIALDMMEDAGRLNVYMERTNEFYESDVVTASSNGRMSPISHQRRLFQRKPDGTLTGGKIYDYEAARVSPHVLIENVYADPFEKEGGGDPLPPVPVCQQSYCTKLGKKLTVYRTELKDYPTIP